MTKAFSKENYFGNMLGIPAYDYIENTYTGENLTQIVYKIGGSTGTIVATIVLTYDGTKLLTLERIH